MIEKLKAFKDRYDFLMQEACKPKVVSDLEKWKEISKEQTALEEYATLYDDYTKTKHNLESSREVLKETDDPELKAMAEEEIKECEEKLEKLENDIKIALLPKDSKDDSKEVIIEVRSGAGGDESSLFGAELFNMYKKYAEKQVKMNFF